MSSRRDRFFSLFGQGMKQGADGFQQAQSNDLRQLLQTQSEKAELEKQGAAQAYDQQKVADKRQYEQDTFNQMAPQFRNRSLHVGDLAVGGPDTSGFAMSDKIDDNMRLETKALSDKYEQMGVRDTRKQLGALAPIKELLANPRAADQGRLGTLLRNLVESGVATDADIARQLPTTARGVANKLSVFLGQPDMVNPYSEEQLQGLNKWVGSLEGNIRNKEAAATKELDQVAPMLAPTLNKRGVLKKALGGVGSSMREGLKNTSDLTPEEQAEREQLKKELGQ
jgi:hypothetical protein